MGQDLVDGDVVVVYYLSITSGEAGGGGGGKEFICIRRVEVCRGGSGRDGGKGVVVADSLVRISVSNESKGGFSVCCLVEAVRMAVVRESSRPRNNGNDCIVMGYGGMVKNCGHLKCTLILHVSI